MKVIGTIFEHLDCRYQIPFLVYASFYLILSIIVSSSTDENLQRKNSHVKSNASDVTKDPQEIKLSSQEYGINDSLTENSGQNRSRDIQTAVKDQTSSVALNRFLENFLKAQYELQWINQAVKNLHRRKKSHPRDVQYMEGRSKSSYLEDALSDINIDQNGNKLRDKRGFDHSYETMWLLHRKRYTDKNNRGTPNKIYLNNNMMFENNLNRMNLKNHDVSQHRWPKKETHSTFDVKLDRPVYEEQAINERASRDWTRADLRSSSDSLDFNKNLNSLNGKRENRKIGAYETRRENNDNLVNSGSDMRDQLETPNFGSLTSSNNMAPTKELELVRRETKAKEMPVSLKSLKETVLELKRTLVEGNNKLRESVRSLNGARIKNIHERAEGSKKRRGHHEDIYEANVPSNDINYFNEENVDTKYHWWDDPRPTEKTFDLEKIEGNFASLEDKNTQDKLNTDQKEFLPRSIQPSYPEERYLQERHNRKRRSKEESMEEKSFLDSHQNMDKVNVTDTLNNITIARINSNDSRSDNQNNSSIFVTQSTNIPVQQSQSLNYSDNYPRVPVSQNQENVTSTESESCTKSDMVWYENRHTTENTSNVEQSTTVEKTVDNLGGNSSWTFGFATNESQTVTSMRTFANVEAREEIRGIGMLGPKRRQENVGSSQREQVIKVFEPQEHPYQTSGSTKELERIEPDEKEPGKLFRQMAEVKNHEEKSGNVNVLLESENRDLIRFSNVANRDNTLENQQEKSKPLTFDAFKIKKELVVAKENNPDKSISTIVDIKIKKAHVDSFGEVKHHEGNTFQESSRVPIKSNWDLLSVTKNEPNNDVLGNVLSSSKVLEPSKVYGEKLKDPIKGSGKQLSENIDINDSDNSQEHIIDKQMHDNQRIEGNYNGNAYEERDKSKNDEADSYDNPRKAIVKNEFDIQEPSNDDSSVISNKMSDNNNELITNEKIHKKYSDKRVTDRVDDSLPLIDVNHVMESGYTQRKLLEKAKREVAKQVDDQEYLNLEDVPLNYGDEEDDEDPIVDNESPEVERERRLARKGRVDRMKAKVDVLMKQKKRKKNENNRGYRRERRNPPNVIEYYDYDAEKQERDARFINSDQQRMKNNRDQNSIETQINFAAESVGAVTTCEPAVKTNEHAENIKKTEKSKAKLKNKTPKEEFIVDLGQPQDKNVTENDEVASTFLRSSAKVKPEREEGLTGQDQPRRLDQGEDNVSGINRGRLTQPQQKEEDLSRDQEKYTEGDRNKLNFEEPVEYILNVREKLDPERIDDLLEDLESIQLLEYGDAQTSKEFFDNFNNQRNEGESYQKDGVVETKSVMPLFDELKQVYDWNYDELKSKPRLKGDQRLYHETDNKFNVKQIDAEPLDRINDNEERASSLKKSEKINIEDLSAGSGVNNNENEDYIAKSIESTNKNENEPSGKEFQLDTPIQELEQSKRIENPYNALLPNELEEFPDSGNNTKSNQCTSMNVSNAFAGTSQEINTTEGKLRETLSSETSTEWKIPKVIEVKNDTIPQTGAINWTLVGRQYTNTESDSPYENHKFIDSQLPQERIQSIDHEKSSIAIDSKDLHESFVEPLDWIDDADDNINIRLGRGLKSIEIIPFNSTEKKDGDIISNMTNTEMAQNSQTDNTPHKNKVGEKLYVENKTTIAVSSSKFVSESDDKQCTTLKPRVSQSNLTNASFRLVANLKKSSNVENSRIKREIASRYRTLYGTAYEGKQDTVDINEKDAYSANRKLFDYHSQAPILYEDPSHLKYIDSDWHDDSPESFILESAENSERHGKVARDTDSGTKKKRGMKKSKHYGKLYKKRKKKNRHGTSKYSRSSSHRNRREHKQRRPSATATKKKQRKNNRKHVKKKKTKNMRSSEHTKVRENRVTDKNDKIRRNHHGKSKTAISGAKILHENAALHSTTKSNDGRGKEITVMLETENIEDESQMDSALHGELAGKIVDQIFEQVHKNEALRSSLVPGLYRKHKPEDAALAEKNYRQSVDEDEMKHTEELMKKVMELLSQLIVDEVQKKTCVSLPPDLREFLAWILDVDRQDNLLVEAPTLPLIHNQDNPDYHPQNKFLFNNTPIDEMKLSIDEIFKKVRIMQSLIKEYNSLTEKEKTRVQTVHDYLIKQLDLLLTYIEKEEMENERKSVRPVGAAKSKEGNILEYQSAMSNRTNEKHLNIQDTFPTLVKPNLSKSINTSLNVGQKHFRDSSIESDGRGYRRIRSLDKISKQQSKSKRRKKRKRKRRKHRVHNSDLDKSSRNLIYDGSLLRQKRAYMERDFGKSHPTDYAVPLVEKSQTMNRDSKEIADDVSGTNEKNNGEIFKENTPRRNEDFAKNSIMKPNLKKHIRLRKKRRMYIPCKLENITNDRSENKYQANKNDLYDTNDKFSIKDEIFKKFARDLRNISSFESTIKINRDLSNETNSYKEDLESILGKRILNKAISFSNLRAESTNKGTHEFPTSPVSLAANDKAECNLPIKGKNRAEDEAILLNKREAWKKENEEQLEEVAFGKDMRKSSRDKKLFEKLTEIDKKKNTQKSHTRDVTDDNGNVNESKLNTESNISCTICNTSTNEKNITLSNDCTFTHRNANNNNESVNSSDEDELKILERKINVFTDDDYNARKALQDKRL